jgi:hypothetical protein
MRQMRWWASVIVVVLMAVTALAVAAKRTIGLELTLPTGGTPQLKVLEGESASVEFKDGRKFGFVPTFQENNDAVVVVRVFDLKSTPHQQLGTVEVSVGGDTVQSDTNPTFGVRVSEVRAKQ